MDFLTISQKLADRADVPREGLTDVTTATGELALIVDWANEACRDLQTNEELDWKFLHTEYTKEFKPGQTLDAGAAVDNGSGLVGLPSTAHGYVSGEKIVVIGTTEYDGTYTLDATTSTNQLVVTATYVAETFDGTEQAFIKDNEFHAADNIQKFDPDSFYYYRKTQGENFKSPLKYLDYSAFQEKARDYRKYQIPQFVTETPTKSLRVYPAPSETVVVGADAFLEPQVMSINTDIPVFPENFHM